MRTYELNTDEILRRKKISDKMKENFKNGLIKGWIINMDKERRSYPEKFFIKVFEQNGLNNRFEIKEKFPYGKYFIDFLFVEIKLIVEIDGEQHHKDDKSKNHDKERDLYFLNEGFKIYRIRWKDVFNNTQLEIFEFLKFISNIENETMRKYNINECKYQKKIPIKKKHNREKDKKCQCGNMMLQASNFCRNCWVSHIKEKKVKYVPKRKNKCENCGTQIYGEKYCKSCYSDTKRKSVRPTLDTLLKEVEEIGYSAVGRKYGVSDNSIRKWIKLNN